MIMKTKRVAIVLLTVLAPATFLTGCGSSPSIAPKRQIAVTDLSTIAGRWDGTAWKIPGMDYSEKVLVLVKPNGSYKFVGQKVPEFRVGIGTFSLTGGRVV